MRAKLYPGCDCRRRRIAAVFALLVAGALATTAGAQERTSCIGGAPGAPSVFIDSTASEVTVVTTGGARVSASRNLLLCPGDEVQTGATGRVAIRFDEKRTVIRLDGNSRTRVLSGGTGSADVSLLSGILYFVSSVRRHFEVDTPYIVAGIDGTEALVAVRPRDALAMAAVREGLVSAYDHQEGQANVLQVAGGEAAYRSAGVPFQSGPIGSLPPPFRELLIVSDSAVDWAVYYPPVLLARDAENAAVRRAVALLSSGEYEQAEAVLAAAGASADTAALRTIIAISRNRIADAEHWSALALQADPQSSPALVAASYVRQAQGDLDGALEFARSAADAAPRDAYAVARLAELQMIVGDRRAALATAGRSLSVERLPLALFVAGLAHLAASQYEVAEALFQEAIALDVEAPLPRLGLGLTYIRQGKTAAGTWEIERAVIHDPRRASLRTWLGRAYFEEALEEKAAEELRIAIAEDPEDPTPYLFSALQLYAQNRPILALRALREAERHGAARNVLRSARGLDEDSATRGAAIGRIYDVLGFDQLAVVEGSKAADAAPANPGAHRFLADAFSSRVGEEIAQTSELLRSQLLSPPSKTPVQPKLGEDDLALLDTTGPSKVTFAEFSPLFDADGFRFDASGALGMQDTLSGEAAATLLYRGFSLSLGEFHYQTDGYRDNNDLSHDIFNAVTTLALTPEFSLFGEYRYRETEAGDRGLNFDIDAFDPTLRSNLTREIGRVGFHAELSPSNDLIGVYTNARLEDGFSFADDDGETVVNSENDSNGGQLQLIHQGDSLNVVAGGNVVHSDLEASAATDGFVLLDDTTRSDYLNAYTYLYLNQPRNITWTLGAGLSRFVESDDGRDLLEFLPKLGVVAQLGDRVTIRAAYLRNLKPNLVSEQVIEPTTVAGFNQFYDSLNASIVEQAGVAIDLRATPDLLVGAEALERWWEMPQTSSPGGTVEERVLRAYAYLTATDRIALSAELLHEESNADFSFDLQDWRTSSVPLKLSYFSETGLFGNIGIEFVDHDFSNFNESGSDFFKLLSGQIGYRLPHNRGIVTLEGLNLLDERFHYQTRSLRPDIATPPRFAPERTILARASVRF